MFFGSWTPVAITVDKPPAAMWLMGLFGRLFGLRASSPCCCRRPSWVSAPSHLLYLTVRRTSGPGCGPDRGTGAGADAGGHADVPLQQPRRPAGAAAGGGRLLHDCRAIDASTVRRMSTWMALAGCALGFAFLTEDGLQAFLVVPGLALAVPRRGAGWPVEALGCVADRRSGDDRLSRVVRQLVSLWPAELASLHRRFHGQQPAAVGFRLQRHRADRRKPRWRSRWRRSQHIPPVVMLAA